MATEPKNKNTAEYDSGYAEGEARGYTSGREDGWDGCEPCEYVPPDATYDINDAESAEYKTGYYAGHRAGWAGGFIDYMPVPGDIWGEQMEHHGKE